MLCVIPGVAIAHDGPEEHKPGEIPLVNNGPGPQVVYGEVSPDDGHLHKTELKQGEFKSVSGFGTADIPEQQTQQPQEQEQPLQVQLSLIHI